MISEFIENNPRSSIILFSFIVTALITLVNYLMTDREKMKEIRERQKELKLEMKKYRDNPEKMLELNKKMMADMPEQLKHSFKPMIVTIVPLLIFFAWLRSAYAVTTIASSWIWWYIGSSIIFSLILRKATGLQ